MKFRLFYVLGAIIVLGVHGFARFLGDPLVPVDRLITNTTAYIKEHPDDAMGPYTLARIHYLALATGSSRVLGRDQTERNPLPTVNEPIPPGRRGRTNSAAPSEKAWTEAQLREHLQEAVENYQKALKMDGKNALFHLGLASLSQAALNAGFKLGPIPGLVGSEPPKDGDFSPLWREQAIEEYLKAYNLSVGTNDTTSYGHIASGEIVVLISAEAGQQYVELVTARGVRDTERPTVDKIRTEVARSRNAPIGERITPIIFRLSGAAPLADLLDPQETVTFDLDGTRRPQRYKWLRPDTGILVWDPSNAGKIVSGHQLFGSVSFHMFWSDGYRALDALDDNRDGELKGAELKGMAVWFDRNQNGVSESGEVIPIDRTGIAAISVRATSCIGASLANEAGLTMSDGRVLPTYDWTTKPLDVKVPLTSWHSLRSRGSSS
jgi:hypothetical protein